MTFSREFLAEFHAGVHPDDPQLLARIYADERAVAYLEALEGVTDLLRQYGRGPISRSG
ncbi:hypothetical protein [Rhodococcus zopfii]|uniref:hypothetical protein n=1 Tax=Rhodococcus zopfii TaxID=43772 RepID=UPI000ABEAAE7|nr:hypothetical protein [Rhodococcus zopfii]